MKRTIIPTLILLAFAFVPSPAASHYADCAIGMSGAGSVWCSWSCTAGHAYYVQTQTNNGIASYVDGRTQCGSAGTASCASYGLCNDGDWATSHQDGAGCYGSSTNSGGFTTQCWEPGGSSTNWPLPTCDSLECTLAQVKDLASRATGTPPAGVLPAGLVMYSFADHAVGYSCSADMSYCNVLVPLCTVSLTGVKACQL